MATYRIDRARGMTFSGKFKFDFQVTIGNEEALKGGVVIGQSKLQAGAYVRFNYGADAFEAECFVGRFSEFETGSSLFGHPWVENGGTYGFGNFYGVRKVTIPLTVRVKADQGISITQVFTIDVIDFDIASKQVFNYSGSVEGEFFYGMTMDEYVDIDEYYPSENYFIKSPVCPDNENEYWKLKDLNETTIRQWPKYTTLKWYELPNPKYKVTCGFKIKTFNSKGNVTTISKTYTTNAPLFNDYSIVKQLNAWTGTITNSGYISASSNVQYSDDEIYLKTNNVAVDSENFTVNPFPGTKIGNDPQSSARIDLTIAPSRKATFEAQVHDWKKLHTDKFTAYLVGFGSTGFPRKKFNFVTRPLPLPSYKKIETTSGVVSAEQTFKNYYGWVQARENDNTNIRKDVDFNNTQLWLYGMLDGTTFKGESLDSLESPSSHYDFPDYWVRSANGCRNINEISQELTIDSTYFPGPSPISLRGWKFNCMSLKQDKEIVIKGSGNSRSFLGTSSDPHYYGNQNFSGYRYLNIQIKSKNNDSQSSEFLITENSKGPTLNGNYRLESNKTWNVNTSSSNFQNLRIDLCNPDNKIDFVDNQDSPYPRLNVYTTSKPQSLKTLGYLSVENNPKDTFLVTKPEINQESSSWINDSIKKQILQSGYVYLTDENKQINDYFEVNPNSFIAGVGTNLIFGKPRITNGKVQLAKPWSSYDAYDRTEPDRPVLKPFYRTTLFLKIKKNDLTNGKTINELLFQDKDGKYPEEFEIFDYDPGFPDISNVVTKTTVQFVDGDDKIFINSIPSFENQTYNYPYNAILLEYNGQSKIYEFFDYYKTTSDPPVTYFSIKQSLDANLNIKFPIGSTIKLCFIDGQSDDTTRSYVVKFSSVEKYNDYYIATIEYAKKDKYSQADYEGLPVSSSAVSENITYFQAGAPIITVNPVRLNEVTFPVNSLIKTNLVSKSSDANEVNAIDDYPEDEISNGPYYGVSRISKIELANSLMELGEIKLLRTNSLSNFVIAGNKNTFESQTKFNASSTTTTSYYTRRFWQQNTDARDEEEGDITWQHTVTQNLDYWTLFPKTISGLCEDINKIDEYVAPRWLNPANPSSQVIRHPGWQAISSTKSYPVDPVTGERIYGNNLDPDYLNSDSGYASWVFGGGILALPSGKNSGSGTSYVKAIDINFNNLQTILAQTIFHRINGDFPPGKPDLFGNTSLINDDGTKQESTLHLRGGLITRSPGYGLILPPKQSSSEDVRQANLVLNSTKEVLGSGASDARGYFETSGTYSRVNKDHYIELEKSKNFATPSSYRSSVRNFSQAKRERASYKGGKQNVATNLSACESGFEKSIVIAYTIPTTKPGEENQTAIITTDSFFTQQYEKYPVGYNTITGTGVTIKGEFPFVLGSETHINQASRVNAFLFTEKNSSKTATNSHYYESLIAANTDMRNKLSWFPFIDGEAKIDANFSTLSKAFTGTKYNSYAVSDQAPQLFNVGYADPGAIVFRSVSLNTTSINAPITDKTIFIDGVAPTYISDFRLIEPISSSGTAYSSFPTVSQISSREYIVAYSLNSNPRQINFKIISDYQALEKNVLFDLDALTGNTLSDKYNIYGLTSDYDEKLNLHRSVFWCNGGIYYFEYNLSSKVLGAKRSDKLHLIKGKLDEALVTELINRSNIVTYYDSQSELNAEVPKQKPALISCKKQDYNGKVLVAYDSGKCYIEAVLFDPYADILGTRKFDIECVNTSDSTVKDSTPVADIQANPISGQSTLLVNFLSTNSYDPGGSTLTYAWNFGDETQSTEENPVHTFVNNTTDPIQFKVTLIVTNTNGISSDSASIVITVNPAPVNNLLPQAKFSATPTSGDVTLTVTFTNNSTPANDNSFLQIYEWDFGDGNTSIKFDNASFTYDYTRSGTFIPSLKVKDNLERISDKFVGPTINVNGVLNNPPAPGFRSAQTSFAPTLKVQFTDTSSDDEGPIVAWNWKFGDDQTADVQNPEHIYASAGKYLVMLTVTDSGGLQASGSKEITVLPPGNNPPIANFSYSQQNRKLVIDFTDTSTDSDGAITTWNWDFGDNSFDTIQNPSHSYLSAGTYQVSVTVTDNGGKSNSITKNVVVNPLVNQSPIISNVTGIQTSFKPLVGKFTEVSSDPDGFITNWDWNFGDGSTFSTTDSTLKNPTHTYVFPGIYTVSLTVTDDGLPDGTNKKTTTSSIQFTVTPPPANQPPIALFTVDTNNVFAPVVINFTDASIDADGRIVSWLWEFETGRSVFYNAQTYQKTVTYTFNKSGTYPVKLTVRDDGNLSNTYVLDIVIKNNAPVPILSASPNPVLSQTLVSFFGNNSYDSDGNITKYAWDFGDGTVIAQGTTFESHTYSKPGTYKSSLTVTDNIGDSSTANLLITVTNRNPVARITYTSLNVKAPGSLTLNGDTSSDQDGIIVSYNWTVSNGLSASTPNATFNFTTEGTYTVTLLVTDDSGGTNSTSVIVTVSPPDNVLPIAILVSDKNTGVINDTFVFNSSSSYDPDGNIILYKLDFGDGTTTQFVTPALVSHIYKSIGVFTAKLSVIDNRNGISVETLNSVQKIIINNQPPIANFTFGPNNAFTFDPVTFTDTSTDPDNAINKWVWNYGDGTTFTTTDPLQKSPQKSYDKGNKDYVVSLTVYDNLGLFSKVTQTVRINNRKPFAVISTNKTANNNTIVGIAPFTVVFDSNSYDLDGSVVNYEWYLNGISGTPITTKSFTYTFTNARFTPYVVTLKVQDDDGEFSDLAYIGVKVNAPNIPPVAVIRVNPASRTRQAPVTVDFSGAGSYDPDNVDGPLIYSWDFGNGSFSDQVNASTVYSQPGTYKVSLTVTDNLAATNSATLDYIVLNNKPVALLDTVPSGIVAVKLNTPIVFTSSGSFDTDINQFINGYKWLKDGVNQNSNTPTLETSFDSVGNHTITLSVFDNLGLESDLVNKTVFVFDDPIPPPNQNPIAILGNEPSVTGYVELKVGDSFTFNGANSYDVEDGSNITYEWSIDGVKSGFTSTFTNQFNTAGIFTISLAVFDTKKLSSTTATNLGNRNQIQVNVSAVSNPLTNKLFSSGQALYGAIASGSNTPDRYGFQLVDDTKQYTVIESGLYHTFVVDAEGKLYASGSNSNGQLGFPSNITQQNSLTLVPLASKYKVVKVSAGDLCSAIIAEDTTINKRVLLVCGSNINGIFGQALPRTNIYNFQPILERSSANSGVSYSSNNGLLDVSCNSYILAFTDNRQVWVAGNHNYNKTGISDTGFYAINIDPNPDVYVGSKNYLNPFKLEVGFNNSSGFVTGLSYDIDSQIVWFTGLSSLRGLGYAYDISTYENRIVVITASQDPYYDHAIYLYNFSASEIPQFDFSSGLASDLNPGENFLKVSTGKFGFLALSENLFYPYGLNDYGQLGYVQSISSSAALNLRDGIPGGVVLPNMSILGISNIAAGGNHSIILASNVKPSSYSFTIIRPDGYALDPQYPTIYPTTQSAG